MRKTLNFIFYAIFAVLLVVGGVMLFKSWTDLRTMRLRVAELEAEVHAKNDEMLELLQDIHDLKHNPNAIEKIAREKFKLVKKGEVILTYETRKNKKDHKKSKQEE